jgi:hypothetical protein
VPESATSVNGLHRQLAASAKPLATLDRLESAARLWASVWGQTHSENSEIAVILREISAIQTKAAMLPDLSLKQAELTEIRNRLLALIQRKLGASNDYVVVNPASHTRRVFAAGLPGNLDSRGSERIIAHHFDGHASEVIVDVPPFGFVRLGTSTSQPVSHSANSAKPTWLQRVFGGRAAIAQDDWTLANEFMEVQIDPKRGHLRSLYIANKRGNHLSGMFAIVDNPLECSLKFEESSLLTLPRAQLTIVENSPLRGTIEARGTVRNSRGAESNVVVRYTLWKGARFLEIRVECDGLHAESNYAIWRTAWASEAGTIAAWQNGMQGKLGNPLQSLVELVEIDEVEHRVHLAPEGLSMHRRMGYNTLVSALPIDASGVSHSVFSLGLDWQRPWENGMDRCDTEWIAPPSLDPSNVPQSTNRDAWLSQCNAPNIRYSFVDSGPELSLNDALSQESSETPRSEETVGLLTEDTGQAMVVPPKSETPLRPEMAFWFVETQGRSGTAKFSFARNVERAWRVDFLGNEFDKLKVEDGHVLVSYKPWERSRVAVIFERSA